jgi:hypothetical protein
MLDSKLWQRWSPEEDTELRTRLARRESFTEIAKAMRRGEGSIRNRTKGLGLTRICWTPEEDARLREAYGKVPTRDLAKELYRSTLGLKQRALKLGINAGRLFTPEQLDMIRDLYPTHTAEQIAAMLPGRQRHTASIGKIVGKLGLHKVQFHSPEIIERVKQLHADGCPDRVIAERMGLGHDQVKHIRSDRLKLPTIIDIEAKRKCVQTQRATLGIKNSSELRTRAHAAYVIECGWPPEWNLRVREVQILNVLATRGPMRALEIAEAIGANTNATFATGAKRTLLSDSGRDGTYTTSLLKKGLIVYFYRAGKGKPTGNRKPGFYQLSAESIRHLEERADADTDKQAT